MATHSSQMIYYSAAKFTHFHEDKSFSCREKFTHFHEDKSFFHVEKSSRTFMQRKVFHIEKSSCTFMQRKVPFMKRKVHALSWLAHGISPTVFDPMVLVCGIASKSVDLMHFHGWFMVLV